MNRILRSPPSGGACRIPAARSRASTAVLLLMLAGTPWACSAAPADASARLAFVGSTPQGHFELRLADPARKSSEKLMSLLSAPTLVLWRTDRSEVTTVADDGVYTLDYGHKPYVANPAGDGPPEGLNVRDGWYAKDGSSLQVVGWQADKSGNPVCALYSVPAVQGAWRRLDKPAPVRADDDCAAFASQQRNRSVSVSSAALLAAMPCASAQGICGSRTDPREAGLAGRVKQDNPGAEGVALADPGGSAHFLAFGVISGDTPHLSGAAVYAVRRDTLAVTRVPVKAGKQLQVAIEGRLALVAGEYEGSDPAVIDLDEGKLVFSAKGSGAVWLPRVDGRR